MDKKIQTTFIHPTFGEIRTEGTPDKPLFCLADVCKALDLDNNRQVKTRLNPKGVTTNDTLTDGGRQSMTFIDEPNLYKCVFQSRKKEAEIFQEWVYNEVLPSLRKTGRYACAPEPERPRATTPLLSGEDFILAAVDKDFRVEDVPSYEQTGLTFNALQLFFSACAFLHPDTSCRLTALNVAHLEETAGLEPGDFHEAWNELISKKWVKIWLFSDTLVFKFCYPKN